MQPTPAGFASHSRGVHPNSTLAYRLSAVGYRLSAVGYRLSVIGYRLFLSPTARGECISGDAARAHRTGDDPCRACKTTTGAQPGDGGVVSRSPGASTGARLATDDRLAEIIRACAGEEGVTKPYGRKVVSIAAAAGGQSKCSGHKRSARVHSGERQAGVEDLYPIDAPGGMLTPTMTADARK